MHGDSAPVSSDTRKIPWDDARQIVVDAYSEFSDEAGAIVARFFDDNWIDGPVRPDKRPGAFCATTVPGVRATEDLMRTINLRARFA